MTNFEFDAEAYVAAAAPAMGLSLTDEQRKGVLQFVGIAAQMAKAVYAAPIADDVFEPAPVFCPDDRSAP